MKIVVPLYRMPYCHPTREHVQIVPLRITTILNAVLFVLLYDSHHLQLELRQVFTILFFQVLFKYLLRQQILVMNFL